jgi:hypothetical protein
MLSATRPAPWPGTSAPVGRLGPRRRSRTPASGGPGYGQPHASQPRPTPHHPFPSGPMPAGDHAARRPRRHVNPPRPAGAARHTEPLRGPARRGQRGSARTPGPVRPDTRLHRTPEHGRLDTGHADAGRPLDRLDGRPHRGPDEADTTTTGLAGVRTSSRPATTARRPDLARVTAPESARPPRTAPRDGTGAAALTAAATGQLPSTTRHEAAPRRTALLGRIGSRLVRRNGGHPVHGEDLESRTVP